MEDAATLIPLDAVDPALVEELLDQAFGADRKARTAYKIRDGLEPLPALSFALLDEGEHLAGTIQAWPVALTDPHARPFPLVMVGPVAVLPQQQDKGFGHALMAALFGALDDAAPLPQVLIGDPEYYTRFGFSAQHTGGWRCPGPWDTERLMVRCANPEVLPREGMLGPWGR
ncbi:GNAT family N-acetyltransferase [Paraurantiacibacter namhicola]|uniref:N-acetyltransferase domain-containing protein n=1 Tax=Paraurantiacibacter namhicola TaxID=645517 RepID=A0A1C7D7Q4_9SPHN|nr:N-acetyltransferase [Paraurantiacibacter namhicola]ANU07504.1 hypothetical protein A6F65_01197 [Paraurantiacibacter namhicola]